MPVSDTTTWEEKQQLEADTGLTTTFSLYDLRRAYYGGGLSTTDRLRAYLQSETGLTTIQSLSDLWRQFFITSGIVNQVSISDMAKVFFGSAGPGLNYNILLENGGHLLIQSGFLLLKN